MARKSGDDRSIAFGLLNLGRLAVEQDEPDLAETLLLDALRTFRRVGDADSVVESLQGLGWAAGLRNEPDRAATLLGAAEAAREDMGIPMEPVERERYERLVALSRREADEESWVASWNTGLAMSLKEATLYALSSADGEAPALSTVSPATDSRQLDPPLSRREQEVAFLLARGFTNRQIATELVLSEHTVDTHVHNILRKLGLRSRAQVAVWIMEQLLLPGRLG